MIPAYNKKDRPKTKGYAEAKRSTDGPDRKPLINQRTLEADTASEAKSHLRALQQTPHRWHLK